MNKGWDNDLGQKSIGKHGVSFVKMDKATTGPTFQNTKCQVQSKIPVNFSNIDSIASFSVLGDIESWVKENMQYGNLDGVKVHFNPTFEGPEGVEVSMTDGVLDPEKHSAVIFKENLHSNQQGISVKRTIETLGVGISSPKDRKNGDRDSIGRSGYSGGKWLGWKDSIRVEVVCSHPQFILTHVYHVSSLIPVLISFVYGSPNLQQCKDLWKDLGLSISLGQIPWIVIGNFNAILSPTEKRGDLSNGRRCPHFDDFVDMAELKDLGFRGPPFTWHRGGLFDRRLFCLKAYGELTSKQFPQLDPVDIDFLGRPVMNDEIKDAFFDMTPLKTSGSDGFGQGSGHRTTVAAAGRRRRRRRTEMSDAWRWRATMVARVAVYRGQKTCGC
ncbi:calmodulin-binding transcription activator 3-like isoform X1 [Gossypium australe]|uniref:Calmodulin-binding transcription activator 3-like isoform X1 n=1 Tax=Gossypium australe TaxID=47621 RepID=A0A5B6UUE0_9ROSI|nr:calmodulin-binding transcription activator 3-like isoform X1 [Gossypium australe]